MATSTSPCRRSTRSSSATREYYFEKDAQLEELLVRERIGDLEITSRSGEALKLTEARWGRFVRSLAEFEGWLARSGGLRCRCGRLRDHAPDRRGRRGVDRRSRQGDRGVGRQRLRAQHPRYCRRIDWEVKVVETETSSATHVTVPAALFTSPIYANLRKAYTKLIEIVGPPPLALAAGKKQRAETFASPARGARSRQGVVCSFRASRDSAR